MPDGLLGAKKTDVAELCRKIFLLNVGRADIDIFESEVLESFEN
jgi:hypothetical protein